MPEEDRDATARSAIERWAASGAMTLTGREDGPALGPPAPLVERLEEVARVLDRRSGELGNRVVVDPLGVLAERAALAGLGRQGTTSCGGGTRLLATVDGWIAASLARPDDLELVPAWLGVEPELWSGDPWELVTRTVRARPTAELVAQAVLIGLPVGALPAVPPHPPRADLPLAPLPCRATRLHDAPATANLDGLLVADLSALWAGPLCGSLLADAGATVVKVESTGRPDGARRGPQPFFDLMNAGKRSVALDLTAPGGRRALGALLRRADVVIEASRPRALQQLGVDAGALLENDRPRIWVSITGHGRDGDGRDRVGFGDDAAVAGGLVAWEDGRPRFCADAIADPVSGLVAAAATLDALAAGGTWMLDVAMSGVAAHLAGPTLGVPADIEPVSPSAPRHRGRGPELGADTVAVLHELGVGT